MVLFLPSWDSRAQESRVEMAAEPLTITPGDPRTKVLLPVPGTLCSSGLETLVPKGGNLSPGDTIMIPLDWKLRLPPLPRPLWAPQATEPISRKGVSVLAGVTDAGYQGDLDCSPSMGVRKHMPVIQRLLKAFLTVTVSCD